MAEHPENKQNKKKSKLVDMNLEDLERELADLAKRAAKEEAPAPASPVEEADEQEPVSYQKIKRISNENKAVIVAFLLPFVAVLPFIPRLLDRKGSAPKAEAEAGVLLDNIPKLVLPPPEPAPPQPDLVSIPPVPVEPKPEPPVTNLEIVESNEARASRPVRDRPKPPDKALEDTSFLAWRLDSVTYSIMLGSAFLNLYLNPDDKGDQPAFKVIFKATFADKDGKLLEFTYDPRGAFLSQDGRAVFLDEILARITPDTKIIPFFHGVWSTLSKDEIRSTNKNFEKWILDLQDKLAKFPHNPDIIPDLPELEKYRDDIGRRNPKFYDPEIHKVPKPFYPKREEYLELVKKEYEKEEAIYNREMGIDPPEAQNKGLKDVRDRAEKKGAGPSSPR